MTLLFVGFFGGAVTVGSAWAFWLCFQPPKRDWTRAVIYRKGQKPERIG